MTRSPNKFLVCLALSEIQCHKYVGKIKNRGNTCRILGFTAEDIKEVVSMNLHLDLKVQDVRNALFHFVALRILRVSIMACPTLGRTMRVFSFPRTSDFPRFDIKPVQQLVDQYLTIVS